MGGRRITDLSTAGRWWRRLLAAVLLTSTAGTEAAVVLQYHHISSETPASTSTSPERFAMHLEYLAAQGFTVVPLQDLVDALRTGTAPPDRTAAITFDDGYRSIYETAWPLLRARGWPFTVFVNTEPHDRQQAGFMSWEQLRELQAAGATIANHSISHPYLVRRRSGQNEQAWRNWASAEIAQAEQRIAEQTGQTVKLLAWPYGEYNKALLEIAESLGYAAFGQQSGPLAAYSDLRALPRFPFGGDYGDAQDFATKINSLPLPLAPGTDSLALLTGDRQPLDDLVLDGDDRRPILALRLATGFDPGRLNCFATGQGRIAVSVDPPWVFARAAVPLAAGRSRYNCTAASGEPGRFYWFSQPWIVRPAGGGTLN
jgi:peptidoglycan/xylan/chitin deacetylase (PgdA/CDA1 family)